jgi:hypothetical protein
MGKVKEQADSLIGSGSTFPAWQSDPGKAIAGQEEIDDLDLVAIEMERKWGADRLRTLVAKDLRAKFDRQRYLTNQAIWHGDLEDVKREARRMITAWNALDRAAEAAGASRLVPEVWECVGRSGAVYALVKGGNEARAVSPSGRYVKVYTLDEIANLLDAFPEIAKVKETFHGASVERVRTRVTDPLDVFVDTKVPLNDPMPF